MKTATTRTRTRTRTKKLPEFTVVLRIGGDKYEAKASTIYKALAALKPTKISYKGIVHITRGAQTRAFQFYVLPLRKLMANDLSKQIWGKRMEQQFK